ncbi:thioredoxin domain-containing protein [Haematococcus lacustris]|uniref:Thioredoxin domain-containing protein n=1 Tax=Haematococcus lacustris TaxID=44745 RepID=A0A6A0A3R9_HAELA|nr:thioredoxin domain-containing protein [Haematococcus lacustris]
MALHVPPLIQTLQSDAELEALLCTKGLKDKCEFLEAAKEQRGKSEPLFLLYRNGQLKCRIEGADTPTLSEQIMAFTPANADLDDLEENPMYLARAEKQRVLRGEVVRDNKSGKKGKK